MIKPFCWRWLPLMYPFKLGIRKPSWGINSWVIRYPHHWVFRVRAAWGQWGWLRTWERGAPNLRRL